MGRCAAWRYNAEMLAPKSKMCATAVNRTGGLEEDLYLALYKERLLSREAKRLMSRHGTRAGSTSELFSHQGVISIYPWLAALDVIGYC
jgi:hypothetical protein